MWRAGKYFDRPAQVQGEFDAIAGRQVTGVDAAAVQPGHQLDDTEAEAQVHGAIPAFVAQAAQRIE